MTPAQIQQRVETQVRRLYALGPSFTVKVSAPKESALPSVYAVTVEIGIEGQTDSATFFITHDGRYLLRGEVFDTTTDPFETNRKLIRLEGSPFKGPANAPVIVVAYSDFQCPTCRSLHFVLRGLLPQYPNVRVVFKDFPLAQIHPWAMTAHTAARCAYQQSPDAFWKMHDMIYEQQDIISASSVWDSMLDFAAKSALDRDTFRACMTSPDVKTFLESSIKEGVALRVANTPTVFVNGRRMIGADQQTLEQYLRYELDAAAKRPRP